MGTLPRAHTYMSSMSSTSSSSWAYVAATASSMFVSGFIVCNLMHKRSSYDLMGSAESPAASPSSSPTSLGKQKKKEGAGSGKDTPPLNGSTDYPTPEDIALAIVVRSDVKQSRQQIIQTCTQASLATFKKLARRRDPVVKIWDKAGNPTILRKCDDEQQLVAIQTAARERNIQTHTIIADAEKCTMAVGPASKQVLDDVCDKLVASLDASI